MWVRLVFPDKSSQTPAASPWCSWLVLLQGSWGCWAARGHLRRVGGREGGRRTAKTSFSNLEGWVTGRVCMPLAGPLPSGVTHSLACCCTQRWLPCRAQAASHRGGGCHPWPGEGVTAWGCFLGEICSHVERLPLEPSFPLCFYLQEGAPRALQLLARAHWCGKWGNLLSLDVCPVSVRSIGLGRKPLPFHFLLCSPSLGGERSRPGQPRCEGGSVSQGCPRPALWSLGDSPEHQMALRVCPLGWGSCANKQTRCARGGWRVAACACCGLREQMCWSYNVPTSNLCLGHSCVLVALENSIFPSLLVG